GDVVRVVSDLDAQVVVAVGDERRVPVRGIRAGAGGVRADRGPGRTAGVRVLKGNRLDAGAAAARICAEGDRSAEVVGGRAGRARRRRRVDQRCGALDRLDVPGVV